MVSLECEHKYFPEKTKTTGYTISNGDDIIQTEQIVRMCLGIHTHTYACTCTHTSICVYVCMCMYYTTYVTHVQIPQQLPLSDRHYQQQQQKQQLQENP